MTTETSHLREIINPNLKPDIGTTHNPNSKPKIVVIMGATGSGKSKLAIDLASQFPIEIINADSMQVYSGLDVLTNKVPVEEQKGIPHHLLGTISPNVEFTAKDFRDAVIPIIEDICCRNRLPVIVGGTNYYIQALVSKFLLDDHVRDLETDCLSDFPGEDRLPDFEIDPMSEDGDYTYSRLKDLDIVAANRIHPNDHRKIKQYILLHGRSGVLPSKLFRENAMEALLTTWHFPILLIKLQFLEKLMNWGRADNLRYDCCFVCVDASLSALDQYLNQRVDLMIENGLLLEVREIYKLNADYTRGLRQAIGVREFEDFLRYWNAECEESSATHDTCEENLRQLVDFSNEAQSKIMLTEAIEKVKLNTRRLVRRQKRRLSRLGMLFGWNIQYVDVTPCLSCASDDVWNVNVVEPSVKIIRSFLDEALCPEVSEGGCEETKLSQRDLWTLYICQACGNKELRGAHEWEQHKQGRAHRKRVCRLRKSGISLDFPQKSSLA